MSRSFSCILDREPECEAQHQVDVCFQGCPECSLRDILAESQYESADQFQQEAESGPVDVDVSVIFLVR